MKNPTPQKVAALLRSAAWVGPDRHAVLTTTHDEVLGLLVDAPLRHCMGRDLYPGEVIRFPVSDRRVWTRAEDLSAAIQLRIVDLTVLLREPSVLTVPSRQRADLEAVSYFLPFDGETFPPWWAFIMADEWCTPEEVAIARGVAVFCTRIGTKTPHFFRVLLEVLLAEAVIRAERASSPG